MPLVRLKDEYLEQDGVRFLMADETGNTVACRVSHETMLTACICPVLIVLSLRRIAS